jgi:N utilization substance protein A
VIEVWIDEEHRIANVVVPERMLSLAIGREGQNARLAAKLTGWRIDIRSDVSVAEAAKVQAALAAEAPAEAEASVEAEAPVEVAELGAAKPEAEAEPEAKAKPKRRKAATKSESTKSAVESTAITEQVPS